jgi:hypothetical protein
MDNIMASNEHSTSSSKPQDETTCPPPPAQGKILVLKELVHVIDKGNVQQLKNLFVLTTHVIVTPVIERFGHQRNITVE